MPRDFAAGQSGALFHFDFDSGRKAMSANGPLLFQPLTIKDVTARNRIAIPPMCQYTAKDGLTNDWHLVHYGALARGGAGIIFVEAAGVEARGRITHGCLGLWDDERAEAQRALVSIMKAHGAVPGIQIAHAGRKASMRRPWHGNNAMDDSDRAERGEVAWEVIAPSPLPAGDGWLVPKQLGAEDIPGVVEAFADAARRADRIGYEALEIHGAHGYLIQSFLSPLSNQRNDAYGGDLSGRMRFALEVAEAVRGAWPDNKPLFFRISAVDGFEGGWMIEDSVILARELKALGYDVIDCSSGGNTGSSTLLPIPRKLGYQVPFAARIKQEAGIDTMAVGLILSGAQAEEILRRGEADIVAVGREALYDPYWPVHAAQELGIDPQFEQFPEQYGWWLDKRNQSVRRFGFL
jgi:2,4-dienoyl-CoA reductase-like NADH-dependent reductase (Old Yellow Enzyme family)